MELPDALDDRPRDDEIMAQQFAILAEEAEKLPFIGDKEQLSTLSAEYESGNPVFQEKIEKLRQSYGALRRTRGDGNCFFRAFMFSYLEHILETKDEAEVARVLKKVEQCKQTLLNLGHLEFTFEDFFAMFIELLEAVLPGRESSISMDMLVEQSRDPVISNYVVMFFRFVTSGEIRRRADFFEPFILGMSDMTVEQFCKSSVEPMGEESDHVHIIALSDALGLPIRVVYLDGSVGEGAKSAEVNYHDFIPSELASLDQDKAKILVVLLYRPGHYDILYPK